MNDSLEDDIKKFLDYCLSLIQTRNEMTCEEFINAEMRLRKRILSLDLIIINKILSELEEFRCRKNRGSLLWSTVGYFNKRSWSLYIAHLCDVHSIYKRVLDNLPFAREFESKPS